MAIEIKLDKIVFERYSEEYKRRGLKIPELAEVTGLSKTTLYKLAKGDATRIDLLTLDTLCNALGCEISDILVFTKDSETKFQKR